MKEKHLKRRRLSIFCVSVILKMSCCFVCDLLQDSALAYASLLDKKYHITIAHKCKLKVLTLVFPQSAYFHLAGLQYTGIAQLANGKDALPLILSGNVTASQLQTSGVMHKIEDRLQGIDMLPQLLEAGRIVFRYRGHEATWSDIRADYVAYFPLETDAVLYFTAGDSDEQQNPVSIFRRSDTHYIDFCPRYKVLQIVRESSVDSEPVTVFVSLSYRR